MEGRVIIQLHSHAEGCVLLGAGVAGQWHRGKTGRHVQVGTGAHPPISCLPLPGGFAACMCLKRHSKKHETIDLAREGLVPVDPATLGPLTGSIHYEQGGWAGLGVGVAW